MDGWKHSSWSYVWARPCSLRRRCLPHACRRLLPAQQFDPNQSDAAKLPTRQSRPQLGAVRPRQDPQLDDRFSGSLLLTEAAMRCWISLPLLLRLRGLPAVSHYRFW